VPCAPGKEGKEKKDKKKKSKGADGEEGGKEGDAEEVTRGPGLGGDCLRLLPSRPRAWATVLDAAYEDLQGRVPVCGAEVVCCAELSCARWPAGRRRRRRAARTTTAWCG
jgi:hypothetical protein